MSYAKVILAVVVLGVTGCSGPKAPLNPPQLVSDSETDMSIQLFMQATILLSKYYGYETIQYEDFQDRSQRAGFATLPFMPPVTTRAVPRLTNLKVVTDGTGKIFRDKIDTNLGYNNLVRYYITTGWKASQLLCGNYLTGLDEKNQYFEFLQKEFGVAYSLATAILAIASGNATLSKSFAATSVAVNGFTDVYQDYRFLTIVDRDAARALVFAAQDKYAKYFLDQVNDREKTQANGKPVPLNTYYTFSEALNAVSTIEYQCTRGGIRNLINRSVNNTSSNLDIDVNTGAIIFKSNTPSGTPPANGGVPNGGVQSLDKKVSAGK